MPSEDVRAKLRAMAKAKLLARADMHGLRLQIMETKDTSEQERLRAERQGVFDRMIKIGPVLLLRYMFDAASFLCKWSPARIGSYLGGFVAL